MTERAAGILIIVATWCAISLVAAVAVFAEPAKRLIAEAAAQ